MLNCCWHHWHKMLAQLQVGCPHKICGEIVGEVNVDPRLCTCMHVSMFAMVGDSGNW